MVHADPLEGAVLLRHRRLARCTQPHEEGDQHQPRIAGHEESDDAEDEREALPDLGGYAGGTHVRHPGSERRAQHAPPVHRKGGDGVEEREQNVDPHESREERRALAQKNLRPRGKPGCDEHQVEQHHDRDRDGRTRERYGELPLRLLRDSLELRHSAYRQKRDLFRGDSEVPRRERVPVLVKDHRREHGEDEHDAVHRIAHGSAKLVAGYRHPREQDEKRGVHADIDPRETPQLPRPLHSDVTPCMAPPSVKEL